LDEVDGGLDGAAYQIELGLDGFEAFGDFGGWNGGIDGGR
jgi:hypothetical protein